MTFRNNYKATSYNCNELTQAEVNRILEESYSGEYHNGCGVCGVVEHKTERTLDKENYFENVNKTQMVCWTGKQIYFKNHKGSSVGFWPCSGKNSVYVNKEGAGKCNAYGEYIHKTSKLQYNYEGNIGEEYYNNYFGDSNSMIYCDMVKNNCDMIALYSETFGTIYNISDYFVDKFINKENYIGPTTNTCRSFK